MRRIAIIGRGASRTQAPKTDWEFWGLAHDPQAERFDRLFEIHRPDSYVGWNGHTHNLANLRGRLIVRLESKDLPEAQVYPMDQIARISEDFSCSISYLVAMAAVIEKPDTLGLWGCDFDMQHEYQTQLPNVQFWLGVAAANGIERVFPEGSRLAKPLRYGDHQ